MMLLGCAVFVPAGCTGHLQPLDMAVNDPFKENLKSSSATGSYASLIKGQLDGGKTEQNTTVDLRTS